MDLEERSELNFYLLLLQVLAGARPVGSLIGHPVFLKRGAKICNRVARGLGYDPRDMFQDLCVKLLGAGVKLRPDNIPNENAFFRWVFVLALNMRRDYFRRNGQRIQQELWLDETLFEELSITDAIDGPEVDCLFREFEDFVETLPDQTQRAIRLRCEGYTFDEIAKELSRGDAKGMTGVTVRTWVRNGLRFFRGGDKTVVRKTIRKVV